jgi:hypothetical protein
VAESDGEVMPLYTPDGKPWTWSGSGSVSGTLRTCLKMSALGPRAAQVSLAMLDSTRRGFLSTSTPSYETAHERWRGLTVLG